MEVEQEFEKEFPIYDSHQMKKAQSLIQPQSWYQQQQQQPSQQRVGGGDYGGSVIISNNIKKKIDEVLTRTRSNVISSALGMRMGNPSLSHTMPQPLSQYRYQQSQQGKKKRSDPNSQFESQSQSQLHSRPQTQTQSSNDGLRNEIGLKMKKEIETITPNLISEIRNHKLNLESLVKHREEIESVNQFFNLEIVSEFICFSVL
jgi:hypothetical protein